MFRLSAHAVTPALSALNSKPVTRLLLRPTGWRAEDRVQRTRTQKAVHFGFSGTVTAAWLWVCSSCPGVGLGSLRAISS